MEPREFRDLSSVPMPSVRASLERLEQQRIALLADLGARSTGEIGYRPTPATWSMLDVAEHLMKVERAFGETVEANLQRPLRPVSWPERFGALMVLSVMRSPMRIKTPASASMVLPGREMDLPELKQEWTAVRERLGRLAVEISSSQATLGVFRHPVSGWMRPADGYAFLRGHFEHHGFQLARLRRGCQGQRGGAIE